MVSVNQVDGLTLLACCRVTGGKVGLTDAEVWRRTVAPPRPGVPEDADIVEGVHDSEIAISETGGALWRPGVGEGQPIKWMGWPPGIGIESPMARSAWGVRSRRRS